MYDVTMPKLSDSMEVGQIVKWRVREGDRVSEGDILAEVESDKAVMELECFHDGVVSKILHGDEDEVAVGEVIARIGTEDEVATIGGGQPAEGEAEPAIEEEAPVKPAAEVPPTPAAAREKAEGKGTPKLEAARGSHRPAGGEDRIPASPYARKLAQQRGVDLSAVRGTGPGGRIIARDVATAGGTGEPDRAQAPTPAKAGPPAPKTGAASVEWMASALAERYGVDLSPIQGTGLGGRVTVDDVLAARGAPRGEVTGEARAHADEELPAVDVTEDEAEVVEVPFRIKTQARIVTASKHAIPHFYMTQSVDVTALLRL
jgi:pyruvate dehydrogenase E2 component (dihydrolipoamide acetyltransferase)